MEQTLTLEQLPGEVAEIKTLLLHLKSVVEKENIPQKQDASDEILGVKEAAKLLGLRPQTIYQKRMSGELPFMKRGKKLYFSKKELMAYLKEGKVKSNQEIQEEADRFFNQ